MPFPAITSNMQAQKSIYIGPHFRAHCEEKFEVEVEIEKKFEVKVDIELKLEMWNARRSAALYAEKVEDASERLQGMLKKNHCLNKAEIEQTVRNLPTMSLTNLNALLERTSTSIITLQLLVDVIKQQKKLTEAHLKVRKSFI